MSDKSTPQKYCPACGLAVDLRVAKCPRDGTDLSDPLANDPAFDGKYIFRGLVGSGGMGVIYMAHQIGLEKMVAIKMLHRHLVSGNAVSRFQIEGRAASLLQHRFIVTVHDLGTTTSGQPYMVMDYVNGTTLEHVLATEGQISQSRFLHLFEQVVDALSHAHKHGVLHRDIKPSNIMLVKNVDGQEEVRLMDFGVAKIVGNSEVSSPNLTRTGETVGSPVYMSPEQGRGQQADARSDLYSLGCVMYESLTGTPPFIGASPLETIMMHAKEPPLPLAEASLGSDIDPRIEAVVLKLLEKQPESRYQTMDELWAELRSLKSSRPQTAQPAKTRTVAQAADANQKPRFEAPAPEQPKNGTGRIAVVGACSLVVVGLLSWLGFNFLNGGKPHAEPTGPQAVLAPQVVPKRTERPTYLNEHEEMRDLIEDKLHKREPGGVFDLSDLSSREFKGIKPTLQDLSVLKSEEARMFVRNLILSGLQLDDRDLSIITGLKLERLRLDDNPVKNLHAIAHMNSLKVLSLKKTLVDEEGLTTVSHLPNLIDVDLSRTKLTDTDLCALDKMKLERLALDGTSICDLSGIKPITSLTRLSLEGTHVDKSGLLIAKELPHLQELNLNVTSIKDEDLSILPAMTSLRRVDLQYCPNLTKKAVVQLRSQLPNSCQLISDLLFDRY